MKPYLFLSGLLLGTGISMSSLMADTHVVNASCNDARFGACTSAQTSLPTDEIIRPSIRTTRSIPPSITDAHVVNVPYSAANSHKNDVVRWGGLIVDIENEENHSLIQVQFYPLDESGHPQLDQPSEGEFVIKTSEFIDPEINYLKHSEITVVGTLNGDVKRISTIWENVDGSDVSMPLIVLSEHEKYSYIWSIWEDLYRDAYYSTPIEEVFNITDPRFFTTDYERSLLEETLVIAGKTVVATVVGGSFAMLFLAVATRAPWALPNLIEGKLGKKRLWR